MSDHHTPLDQLSPAERAKVDRHLRGYLSEATGSEVAGRPVEAHLACRQLRTKSEALVVAALELATAYRRADDLVDEIVRGADDEGAERANDIVGWSPARDVFALVVGLLDEAGGAPTVEHLAQLKADHVDLLLGGDR